MCRIDSVELRSLNSEKTKKFFATFSSDIDDVMEDVEVSGNTACAPSPWHAAIVFMILTCLSTSMAEPPSDWKKGEIREALVTNARLIFRGHPDSEWNWSLVPRLQRPGIDKSLARLQARVLASQLQEAVPVFSEKSHPLPARAYLAVAQHYGIPTNLLDFTYDPLIAVYFASHGRITHPSQLGTVYYLKVSDARQKGMSLILPPPPANRLYVQRGLFLEGSHRTLASLVNTCKMVTFPPDDSFVVMRNGRPVNLLPTDRWLDELVDSITKLPREELLPFRLARGLSKTRKPSSLRTHSDFLAHWLHYLHELIDWIIIVESTGGLRFVDVEDLAFLTRSNPHLLNWYAVLDVAEQGGVDLRFKKLRTPKDRTGLTRVIEETLRSMKIKLLTSEFWPD